MRRIAWLFAALFSAVVAVTSAPQATEAPDDGLLEFLGSVDSEDRAWHDYLARTDIDQVARRTTSDPAARHRAATPVPPPDPPAPKPAGGGNESASKPLAPP